MEMAGEGVAHQAQAGEAWLGNDGLEERSDELSGEAPEAGAGQAAFAERGESSSSSMMGSSRRIMRR
jgi:hypothetical protein